MGYQKTFTVFTGAFLVLSLFGGIECSPREHSDEGMGPGHHNALASQRTEAHEHAIQGEKIAEEHCPSLVGSMEVPILEREAAPRGTSGVPFLVAALQPGDSSQQARFFKPPPIANVPISVPSVVLLI